MILIWLAFALGFGSCAAGLALLLNGKVVERFLDHPNHRSLHSAPVARVGGLILHPAWLAGCIALGLTGATRFNDLPPTALLAWLLLFAVSAFDDAKPLSAAVRLPVHLAVAIVSVWALDDVAGARLSWVELAIYMVATAWAMNLYNFMDGANGLAGGMAVIGFGTLALAAYPRDPALMTIAAAVCGAAAGFLLFNFKPARVFLGDAGSVPLGALAALLGIAGSLRGSWSLGLPVLVFLPFVTDATLTLVRRLLRGEPIWQAHRQHGYQKLIQMGWSHQRLAVSAYLLMTVVGVEALLLDKMSQTALMLGLVATTSVMLLMLFAIERRWLKKNTHCEGIAR